MLVKENENRLECSGGLLEPGIFKLQIFQMDTRVDVSGEK